MRKTNIVKKIIILALILALPGFLYYLLMVKGENHYHSLSIFGPKVPAKTSHLVNGKSVPDTIYHTLENFKLFDQDGNAVSLANLQNKITVFSFFYSHCPTLCNTVNTNIDSLAKAYLVNKKLSFVSITVDPQRDSVAALKGYAQKFNPPANWMFLTGDTATIYPMARNGFLVNVLDEGNGNFIYSDKVILIDEHRRIRGYYTGADPDDMVRLDSEIKVLISEELLNDSTPEY
jgi:protein SCO1/2